MNERDEDLVQVVMGWLRKEPEVSEGWELGNSWAGSALSIFHGVPRQYAEPIVGEAVRRLEEETISGHEKAR